MKVKELIDALRQFDPEHEVLTWHEGDEHECEIYGIGFYESATKGNTAETCAQEHDYDHVIIAID